MKKPNTNHNKARKFAELLDNRFTIPGTKLRVGLDPILGVVTGLGDLAGASLSVYFMFYATRLGAKSSVLLRMFLNILADLAIGSIPILGDLFDVVWKANICNARLLEKLEAVPEKLEKESSVLIWLLFSILVLILIGIVILIGWAVAKVWELLI